MLSALLSRLFTTPHTDLPTGTPVNHVRNGHVLRNDGRVIGSTAQGVLVEWCNGGSSHIAASELSVILA